MFSFFSGSHSGDFSGGTFLSLKIYDFTPLHAILGGLLLGTAVVMKMLLKGEILGISGIAKGLVQGAIRELNRWYFLAGLLGASFGLRKVYPAAFGIVSIPAGHAVVAGLAVGLGAALGNGCTSGHGICGNSRLSKRSMVYTACFMASGFLSATLLKSRDYISTIVPAAHTNLETTASIAATVLIVHLVAYLFAVKVLPLRLSRPVTDLLDGSLFAMGLGISGMTNPSKVVQFLDIHDMVWNPTLMFVMAGGLGLATPVMLGIVLPKRMSQPLLSTKFSLPTLSKIDLKLLIGGALFGFGWGVGGMCPGPALCCLANPYSPPLLFVGSMFAGFAAVPLLNNVGNTARKAA